MAARGIDAMVERQGRRFELERRGQVPQAPPCVALSRLPRSGGADLGRRLAEQLHFDFFGIEIVDRMARELGIERRVVAELDEHVRSAVDRYLTDSFRPRAVNEAQYLQRLVRILAAIGEGGGAVILGRGSCYVLPPERTLRVLVVAPRAYRIERLARELGLSPGEADHRLDEEDAERRHFIGHHFGVDPDTSTQYDLVVNTGTLGLEAARALVTDALHSKVGSSLESLRPRA